MDTDKEWEPFADCTPECAVPVPCPTCGARLPPIGRSVPLEWNLVACCEEARSSPKVNTRHIWGVDELGAE